MAITTVDNFVRIFKFYQANPIVYKQKNSETGKMEVVTLRDKFKKNTLLYEDTVDVYLNSLILDRYSQLSFDTDGTTIQIALTARDGLQNYFSKVFYPGSYAYSSLDNAALRRMLLDWSSTIKTIQDQNKRVTDAYSLNDDDTDKAIRGFGIDFINQINLKSLDRRHLFLLNICDLYSIKGSPDSIIKALNIIGIEDIFIREAWICKDPNRDTEVRYDLNMKWVPQKADQVLDTNNNQWVELDTHYDMYTTWDWFEQKIHDNRATFDPHWFYSKEEIRDLNNDPKIYLKLPSITPYFGIEYVSDLDRNTDQMEEIFKIINNQYHNHLTGVKTIGDKQIWVSTFPDRLSALECYTGLIYALIRLDEHAQYENFRSYLLSNKITVPEFKPPYEYLDIIYWLHTMKDDIMYSAIYRQLLDHYIPFKSNNYCSYDNVLKWWMQKEVTDEEKSSITDPYYNYNVSYVVNENVEYDFVSVEWDTIYPFGRYSVQSADILPGKTADEVEWTEVLSNGIIYDTHMKTVLKTEFGDNDNLTYRVVQYHTNQNIPVVFFEHPFNFNSNPQDTIMDRVLRYNGPTTGLSLYNNDPLKTAFEDLQTYNEVTEYDTISSYHKSQALNSNVRVTEIHDDLLGYYNFLYNYPLKSKLFEDKWMNINNTFYDYVTWSIKEYYDQTMHNGCLITNRCEERKWPINKNWNWAVDSKYYYICYEANKWMRCQHELCNSIPESLQGKTFSYGDRVYDDNSLYCYVANNTWIKIKNTNQYVEVGWDARGVDLLPNGSIKDDTKLARTLAVAVVKNKQILDSIKSTLDPTDPRYSLYKQELEDSMVDIYVTPYDPNSLTESYTYSDFLKYLYNSRLTLDFTNGYIYPVIEGYKDDQNRVYLKCKNSYGGTKWVRLNNDRSNIEWDDHKLPVARIATAKIDSSIDNPVARLINKEYPLDKEVPVNMSNTDLTIFETAVKFYEWIDRNKYTISNSGIIRIKGVKNVVNSPYLPHSLFNDETNLGYLLPPYALPDRYDAARILDGKIYNTLSELNADQAAGRIDDETNLVVVRNNGQPKVYEKVNSINIGPNGSFTADWVECPVNRIHECKLGLNPDLIDWIESQYEISPQNYVEIIDYFSHALSSYMENQLGIEGAMLDLILAHWSNNGIIKKIVNYYKPKRARMLFVSNVLEGEYALSNGLDSIGITDSDYNYYDLVSYRWGNPDFNKRNFHRINRVRIDQSIDEYLPLQDTIFKDRDDSNKVYTCRELRSGESQIPSLEIWDELVDMQHLTAKYRYGTVPVEFYADHFEANEEKMSGFYYRIKTENEELLFSNNNYYFQQAEFIIRNSRGRSASVIRWAMFDVQNNNNTRETAFYVADRSSKVPYIGDDGQPLYYADCSDHRRYISEYTYQSGRFSTDRWVKTGLRTIDPVIYLNGFEDERCNGFYYHDSKFRPNVNNRPVYYNVKGKVITFLDASKYYKRTDPNTGYEASKFWVISDYRQIIDFNDIDYFAFGTNNTEETDPDVWDIYNPNRTKIFYRYNGRFDNPELDKSGNRFGLSIREVLDNPQLIRAEDIANRCAEYDKYDLYKRNHFNQVQLKNQPCAYVTCNNKRIVNYYIDDLITVSTYGVHYQMDMEGNPEGALRIRKEYDTEGNPSYLRFGNQVKQKWTVAFRLLVHDRESMTAIFGSNSSNVPINEWLMITLSSNGGFWINKELRLDLDHKNISGWGVNFENVDIKVGEYGVWDYELSEWYIGVITDFRIMRNRPEPQKSTTSKNSNNYRPLFAIEQPRIVYDRWSTGMPENVVGGRLNVYKADKYYKDSITNTEISSFWRSELPRMDYNVIPGYNWKSMDDVLHVPGKAETIPSRHGLINDGEEVMSSGDYKAGDKVQDWWVRYSDDFRTGPIHHRPIYISMKHIVNEPYPTIQWGQEERKANYHDIGLYFDGIDNVDSSNFDGEKTTYLINTTKTYENVKADENTGMNNSSDYDREDTIENWGDTFKDQGSINTIYIPDLDQLNMNQDSFNNCIFHEKLYLYGMKSPYTGLNGEWIHKTSVESWKDGDSKECYSKGNYEAVLTYQRNLGYIWWEIRQKSGSTWNKILRTYIAPRTNTNKLMKTYDLLNYHQIDLSNQPLAEFGLKFTIDGVTTNYTEDEFNNKSWGELTQTIVNENGFGSNTWISISISEAQRDEHPGYKSFFDGSYYYFEDHDTWYKFAAEYTSTLPSNLSNDKTPSGFMYNDGYLYIWWDGCWIRAAASLVTTTSKKIAYELWKFRKDGNTIIINVMDSTNCQIPEHSFLIPNMISMTETFWKLIKFNDKPPYLWWKHMGEEYTQLKSVDNNIGFTYVSLKDTCKFNVVKKSNQQIIDNDENLDRLTIWRNTYSNGFPYVIDSKGSFIKIQKNNDIKMVSGLEEAPSGYERVNEFRYTKIF